MANGAAFSDAIKQAVVLHHGHTGRAFLDRLTHDDRNFCELLEIIKAMPDFTANGGEGQDKRVAARFALLGLAGEIATEYGLTGWPKSHAVKAAADIFKTWQALRGPGNDERRQILEKVSEFIERHGDARFSNVTNRDMRVIDRAGWWQENGDGRTYLFNKVGLREALSGFDFRHALNVLQEMGALLIKPDASGERSRPQRINGAQIRVYPIDVSQLSLSATPAISNVTNTVTFKPSLSEADTLVTSDTVKDGTPKRRRKQKFEKGYRAQN